MVLSEGKFVMNSQRFLSWSCSVYRIAIPTQEPALGWEPDPLSPHPEYPSARLVHHVKEKPARRRFGADAIGQALEMDAPALHPVDQIDQPFHAAAKSIQLPDHEGIGFTQVGKDLFQPWADRPERR
jgi:hypothetical protein